ncbi:MAG: hypothetical protein R3A47_00720 [Polyangiales bacterium]
MKNQYRGEAGRTRTESARCSDGSVVAVYRVLNVAEHPHLRHLALNGELNAAGIDPRSAHFLYHDPDQQFAALVLTVAQRPDEILLRIEQLSQFLDEADRTPRYLSSFSVVYGVDELRDALRRRSERDALSDKEIELDIFDIAVDGVSSITSALPLGIDDDELSELGDVDDLDERDVESDEIGVSERVEVPLATGQRFRFNSGFALQTHDRPTAVPPVDFWKRTAKEFAAVAADRATWFFVSVEGDESLAFQEEAQCSRSTNG